MDVIEKEDQGNSAASVEAVASTNTSSDSVITSKASPVKATRRKHSAKANATYAATTGARELGFDSHKWAWIEALDS